ncbi:MAG: hypothetical protein IH621_08575 [Krumholzibacteria bacterium]|nr:hypothetical protein [Candidatus Krumholzibacteria bacterium]
MATKRIPAAAIPAALALAVVLALAACSDDGGGRPAPTPGEIWPHAEGSAWTYEVTGTTAVDSTLVLPQTLPSMEALHADLERAAPGAVTERLAYIYTFTLAGDTITGDGVPARVIVGTAEPMPPDTAASWGAIAPRPMLLGGSGTAFARLDSAYCRFNSVIDGPAWVYLAGSLVPGSEFTHSWPPGILPWSRALRARIWSVADRRVGRTVHRDVVEVLYRYDLGETDDYQGGTYRHYVGARMWFAPGVGPVAWQERSVAASRAPWAGSEAFVASEFWGTLLEAVLPDVP